ncbi:MAG: hypothetical protein ACOCUT_00125 [bacterium]
MDIIKLIEEANEKFLFIPKTTINMDRASLSISFDFDQIFSVGDAVIMTELQKSLYEIVEQKGYKMGDTPCHVFTTNSGIIFCMKFWK